MELEHLKSAWQQQPAEALPDRSNREIVNAILARLENVQRVIRWRDAREITAAIAGIVLFGIWFWTEHAITARIGCAIIVAGSVLIIVRLLMAHSRKRRPPLHLQVREYCTTERGRLDAQIRLLRSVLWWYLGPSVLGSNLFVFGLIGWNAVEIVFLVFSLALCVVLYRINLRAVRNRLMPLKRELDLLISELDRNGNQGVEASKS